MSFRPPVPSSVWTQMQCTFQVPSLKNPSFTAILRLWLVVLELSYQHIIRMILNWQKTMGSPTSRAGA
jgi:hypothetical protein